ncbi:hypothetical protein ACTWPT_52100 [Nonomuraea sp. 3N208]|uniref:hypothetical protein n=1 Tax=Nonomuraea sp. 3N208 TaxID=3457421 RepID=UPI003FD01D22
MATVEVTVSASPLRSLAIKAVRRPAVWRKSAFVPAIVFTGAHREAQVRIFTGAVSADVPYADVSADHNGQAATFRELIDRAAGEKGDLGGRVHGSLLPAPRFPLTQIILLALRIHEQQAQARKDTGSDQEDLVLDGVRAAGV